MNHHTHSLLMPLFLAMAGLVSCPSPAAEPYSWQVLKSRHFLIHHIREPAFAEKVARQAEQYYETITSDIGFTRFKDFWLWGHRASIYIYPTKTDFREASNAPSWAAGRASSARHEIAGSRDDEDHFLNSVLPHEMAHLILSEFIGADRVPQWLSEGVAQWEETGREQNHILPQPAGLIPLSSLFSMDVRKESSPPVARLYYAQCASLVSFLIIRHGSDKFGRLCRALRDGKTTPEALASAYPGIATSIPSLEAAWHASFQERARP